MTTIAEKDRSTIRDLLARELAQDVELLLFTRRRSLLFVPGQRDCQSCDETRELLDELVSLSDRLHLTVHDVGTDPSAATRFNVTAMPTVIVRRQPVHAGPADTSETGPGRPSARPEVQPSDSRVAAAEAAANVRFLGLPGGYEFSTLLADIVDVSKGRTDLSEAGRAVVQAIDSPVHMQVFVTPT